MAGTIESYYGTNSKVYIIKTDSNGSKQWEKTFGDIHSHSMGYLLQQTSNSEYIVAGYTDSFGAGSYDVYLIKLKEGGDSLLKKYAPVLYFHPDEEFFPKSIYSMLNESDLKRSITAWPDETTDEMPVAVESLGYDNVTEDYYLDMVDASPGFLPSVPNSSRFDIYNNTIYGRIFEPDNRHIVLQYWFFYPFNHFPLVSYMEGGHEGDWEMIQIILNKTNIEPLTSTYSFHHDGRTYNWSEINKINSTHPKVFVSKGGHASYRENKSIWRWNWIFNESLANGDTNIVYYINNTNISELVNNDPRRYSLTKISNNTDWVHFPGRWGDIHVLSEYFEGPNSPANLRYGNQVFRWDDPIGFAENPSPDSTSAVTGSPVNLHAYDSQGRHVGLNGSGDIEAEIPDVYMYVPSDNGSEVIVILNSEDITFEIEATDEGEFDFSLNTHDSDNSIDINLQYEDIQINQNTRATLEFTNTNPNFIIGIDVNGDGITDNTLRPNNIEIVGNYSNNETDFDNDSIADSIDNCVNISNPDQEDWDNDTIGDVCDIETINISLVQGWNLISLPLITVNDSVSSLFNNHSKIFTYIQGEWVELNNESIINGTLGIWIKMLNNGTLTMNGTLPRNSLFMMKRGWNLIGYPSLMRKEVNETFNVSQIESILMYNASDTEDKWKSYNALKPDFFNTLEGMNFGYGYLINVIDTLNWTFNGEFK